MALVRMTRTEYDEVEIELPFYYRHDLDNSCIYGRIEEERCVNVQWSRIGSEFSWSFEVDSEKPDHFACYMGGRYNSNKEEFDAAVAKAMTHIEEMNLG